MEKSKVEMEAKRIIDKFAKALNKIEKENDYDFSVEREDFEREEGKGFSCLGFKEKLLENAPKKNNDFIIAERGDWKI